MFMKCFFHLHLFNNTNGGGDRSGTYLGQQISIIRINSDEMKEMMELSNTLCPLSAVEQRS